MFLILLVKQHTSLWCLVFLYGNLKLKLFPVYNLCALTVVLDSQLIRFDLDVFSKY